MSPLGKLIALFAGLIVGKILFLDNKPAVAVPPAPTPTVVINKHYVTARPRKPKGKVTPPAAQVSKVLDEPKVEDDPTPTWDDPSDPPPTLE
jgi:hypothetical protein